MAPPASSGRASTQPTCCAEAACNSVCYDCVWSSIRSEVRFVASGRKRERGIPRVSFVATSKSCAPRDALVWVAFVLTLTCRTLDRNYNTEAARRSRRAPSTILKGEGPRHYQGRGDDRRPNSQSTWRRKRVRSYSTSYDKSHARVLTLRAWTCMATWSQVALRSTARCRCSASAEL